MKKTRIAILTCLLVLLLTATALAQTTGVQLDGKSYAFSGGPGTYEADGVTFVIDEDSVTVQRPGEAELVLSLVKCEDDAVATEGTSEAVSEVTIMTAAEDAQASEVSVERYAFSDQSFEAGCEDWTPADKQAFFAEYAPFGLKYDPQTDALTYMGRAVRNFLDVRSSNGASLSGGSFRGSITQINNADGAVDVETIRDYARPNASGEGTLTGIVVPEKD